MAFLGAFTARIAFTPAGANETGMAVGDKILLLEKNDGGWWLVHKWVNGQVQRPPGWVPSNYLTEVCVSRISGRCKEVSDHSSMICGGEMAPAQIENGLVGQ